MTFPFDPYTLGLLVGQIAGTFLIAAIIIFIIEKLRGGEQEQIGLKIFIMGLIILIFTMGDKIIDPSFFLNEEEQKSMDEITRLIDDVDQDKTSFEGSETAIGKIYESFLNDIQVLTDTYFVELDAGPEIHLQDTAQLKEKETITALKNNIQYHQELDERYFKDFLSITQKYADAIENLEATNDFEKGFKEGTEEEIPKTYAEIDELITAANNYYSSYTKYYQFVIDQQEDITVENGEVILETEALLIEYNILFDTLDQNEQEYFRLLEQLQTEGDEDLQEVKEILN